jgi:hypothetical protein
MRVHLFLTWLPGSAIASTARALVRPQLEGGGRAQTTGAPGLESKGEERTTDRARGCRQMAKVFGIPAKLAIPFLACCLVATLAGVSRAADKPHLSGNWNLNPKQSDDAQAKIHDAQERSTISRRRSGGGYPGGGEPDDGGYPGGGGGYPGGGGIPGTDYPGGGYPRGGIGGPMGGIGVGMPGGGIGRRGRDGMGREGSGISGVEWEALAATAKTLKIEQRDDQVVLSDDSGRTRHLYPDGKKHKEEDANGKKISTKTQWEGDRLTTESKVGRSGKLTETYRLAEDGKQLEVISRLDDPALAAPLTIRRVYDRAQPSSQ